MRLPRIKARRPTALLDAAFLPQWGICKIAVRAKEAAS